MPSVEGTEVWLRVPDVLVAGIALQGPGDPMPRRITVLPDSGAFPQDAGAAWSKSSMLVYQ